MMLQLHRTHPALGWGNTLSSPVPRLCRRDTVPAQCDSASRHRTGARRAEPETGVWRQGGLWRVPLLALQLVYWVRGAVPLPCSHMVCVTG